MKDLNFSREDHRQMETLGISEEQVRAQIRVFQKPSFFARLRRPCVPGDGIQTISPHRVDHYVKLHEEAARRGRFTKFVPASGAASRMFQLLFEIYGQGSSFRTKEIREQAARGDQKATDFICFQEGLRRTAFFEDLKILMNEKGLRAEDLL